MTTPAPPDVAASGTPTPDPATRQVEDSRVEPSWAEPWAPAPGVLVRLVAAQRAEAELVQLARTLGVRAAAGVTRRCARCGSNGHGVPLLVDARGSAVAAVSVSLARTHAPARSPRAVVGVSVVGPVGVDIEWADAAPPPPALVGAANGRDLLRRWVAVEAGLKALGVGLRRDPASLQLTEELTASVPTERGEPRLRVAVTSVDAEPPVVVGIAWADEPRGNRRP